MGSPLGQSSIAKSEDSIDITVSVRVFCYLNANPMCMLDCGHSIRADNIRTYLLPILIITILSNEAFYVRNTDSECVWSIFSLNFLEGFSLLIFLWITVRTLFVTC